MLYKLYCPVANDHDQAMWIKVHACVMCFVLGSGGHRQGTWFFVPNNNNVVVHVMSI